MGSGFYIEAGPQAGFKISGDIPGSTIEDFAKDLDLAIGLGLGYHSKMGPGIGGRYNIGVSKVSDFENAGLNPDFKQECSSSVCLYVLQQEEIVAESS